MKIFVFVILLLPLVLHGQITSNVQAIDHFATGIDNDPAILKKVYDTVSYQKEDGGENWDSAYNHREVYYKDGQIVKIVSWNKYGNWRNDMVAYYQNNKTIRFSKGESFIENPGYGKLDFQIYYQDDKAIDVIWLTPKPENVLGVGTETFLQWANSIFIKSNL